MALKGLDIFKLTPKTNCKDCGCPTCMAFSMKVAQGAMTIDQCPHMSEDALATLSEASAPPMKTIKAGVKPCADCLRIGPHKPSCAKENASKIPGNHHAYIA